jgi:hypothetical protein
MQSDVDADGTTDSNTDSFSDGTGDERTDIAADYDTASLSQRIARMTQIRRRCIWMTKNGHPSEYSLNGKPNLLKVSCIQLLHSPNQAIYHTWVTFSKRGEIDVYTIQSYNTSGHAYNKV